ncbi:unnamed protein product [Allacma fusca]|uniref:Uncharacterized protein n=1 Tax=Allacma fusca TaxID=39272 RepID=A0A8J2PNP9_9HEXA|nr:unnamed protein product [Allacma fusca]
MSMSEAEQRREARRQRILNNQESRLEKILGKSVPSERIKDEPSSRPGSGLTGTTSQLPLGSTTGNFSTNLGLENGQQSFTTGSWKEGGGVKSLDVPQSRISVRQHHSILCLLSLLSYFLGGPYLLLCLEYRTYIGNDWER